MEREDRLDWGELPHARLVRDLRAGIPEAFEWVLTTHRAALLAYAKNLLDDPQDAEDVVQDAFARLWTRRNSLRAGGSVKSLLYAQVRTRAIDLLRRRNRRRILSDRIPYPTPTPSPSEELLASELQGRVTDAIGNLPKQRRAVFEMLRVEGRSHREVAQVMAVSPQTVANTMSRALADLRSALYGELVEGDRPSV